MFFDNRALVSALLLDFAFGTGVTAPAEKSSSSGKLIAFLFPPFSLGIAQTNLTKAQC